MIGIANSFVGAMWSTPNCRNCIHAATCGHKGMPCHNFKWYKTGTDWAGQRTYIVPVTRVRNGVPERVTKRG